MARLARVIVGERLVEQVVGTSDPTSEQPRATAGVGGAEAAATHGNPAIHGLVVIAE